MRLLLFKYCLLLVLVGTYSTTLLAQDRKALEKKRNEISKEIQYKNKLLDETKKGQKTTINQLVILNKKINQRESLIKTLTKEINLLDNKIEETQALINAMQNDLEKLKEEYAQMIYYAYRNRSAYDRMMFVFSSADFNQAYKRLKYFQQYSQYRLTQVELIIKSQQALSKKVEELEAQKEEKRKLIEEENAERGLLSSEKQEQQSVLSTLKEKEKEIKKEIAKQKAEAEQLNRAIKKVIEEEIRKSEEANKAKKGLTLTPEAQQLSGKFELNKGKLPWPVEKGVITQSFGMHPHPVLKGITINNNGVDINTEEGSAARVLFDGEVTRVLIFPGAGKAIIIRHGEYLTVYSNLEEVYVAKGDKVSLKQKIGKVYTDTEKGKTELHLEIWKGQTTLDPALWLFK
jgi:septal ring factor EnvC (AmiA/AmiB activator)